MNELSLTLVIPVAGEGSRFRSRGWKNPKPLIDVDGRSMIERVIDSFLEVIKQKKITKIVLICRSDIQKELEEKFAFLESTYDIKVVFVIALGLTQGAACTVLLARNFFETNPILIADCDTAYRQDAICRFVDFLLDSQSSLSVSCFDSTDEKFSYIVPDEVPAKIAEKKAISTFAMSGLYFFRDPQDFIDATINALIYNDRDKGEFYISKILGCASRMKNLKVDILRFKFSDIFFFGTPEQLQLSLSRIKTMEEDSLSDKY